MSRFVSVVFTAMLLVLLATPAGAQASKTVSPGKIYALKNSTECAPNTELTVTFSDGETTDPVRLALDITDPNGHFDLEVVIPEAATLGDGEIVVDCGISPAVLTFSVVVVEAPVTDWAKYSMYGAAAIGAAIGLWLVLAVIKRLRARERKPKITRDKAAVAARPDPKAPLDLVAPTPASFQLPVDRVTSMHAASPTPLPVGLGSSFAEVVDRAKQAQLADIGPPLATSDDEADEVEDLLQYENTAADVGYDALETEDDEEPDSFSEAPDPAVSADLGDANSDDEAEYWFWELETDSGMVRRLACITGTVVYLHEIDVEAFGDVIDALTARGPHAVFVDAFLAIDLTDIIGVGQEGTELHLEHMTQSGPRVDVVDLDTEVDEIVATLRARATVTAP